MCTLKNVNPQFFRSLEGTYRSSLLKLILLAKKIPSVQRLGWFDWLKRGMLHCWDLPSSTTEELLSTSVPAEKSSPFRASHHAVWRRNVCPESFAECETNSGMQHRLQLRCKTRDSEEIKTDLKAFIKRANQFFYLQITKSVWKYVWDKLHHEIKYQTIG